MTGALDNATITQLMNAFVLSKQAGGVTVAKDLPWPANAIEVTCPSPTDSRSVLKMCYSKALKILPAVMRSGHNIWGDSVRSSPYHVVCSVVQLLRDDPVVQRHVANDTRDLVFRGALSAYLTQTRRTRNVISAQTASDWRKANGGQP